MFANKEFLGNHKCEGRDLAYKCEIVVADN